MLKTIRDILSIGNGAATNGSSDGIAWFNANDGAIASVPVNGANGDSAPIVRALERLASLDGAIASGVWDSTAGKQEFQFDFDEVLYFLEGEVHVTAEGKTYTFRAGDVAFVRAGTHMSWDVPKYIRKVWIHRYPRRARLRRALRKLRDVALLRESRA
ncbi:MAG: cupin domain-containing protein [Polyangiaceae bacterium]